MPASPFTISPELDKETQQDIEQRLQAAGYIKSRRRLVLEHGYCRSVYVTDPNGMILEFTWIIPDAARIGELRRRTAHSELERWLRGSHVQRANNLRGDARVVKPARSLRAS